MERPALTRLLADVALGKIDVVVVYKVDRLTRSLADFAKIVEIFDGKGVSFVSVTQAFNTTSSGSKRLAPGVRSAGGEVAAVLAPDRFLNCAPTSTPQAEKRGPRSRHWPFSWRTDHQAPRPRRRLWAADPRDALARTGLRQGRGAGAA
jgi:hypothetical protein